jgi:hypothetical protein
MQQMRVALPGGGVGAGDELALDEKAPAYAGARGGMGMETRLGNPYRWEAPPSSERPLCTISATLAYPTALALAGSYSGILSSQVALGLRHLS